MPFLNMDTRYRVHTVKSVHMAQDTRHHFRIETEGAYQWSSLRVVKPYFCTFEIETSVPETFTNHLRKIYSAEAKCKDDANNHKVFSHKEKNMLIFNTKSESSENSIANFITTMN